MKNQITTQTMVRDGEEFIREVLLSVKDHVKKMVVCDTGSIDNTIPIVKELIKEGLNIELIKRGPFKGSGWTTIKMPESAIRNEMINNCKTEWMIIVDDDEIYTKEIFEELYEVLKDDNVMAVAIPFYNFIDRYHVLRKSMYPCMKRVLRAKCVEFRGDWPGASCYIRGEKEWLSNSDLRVKILKNKFYHYNLAKKTVYRPRQKGYDSDIIKFEGKQLEVFEYKIPWIVHEAKQALDEIVNPSFYIFEYGSGGSTFYFLERAKKLITVEHDIEWYKRTSNTIKKLNTDNHEYRLFEPQKIDQADQADYSNYVAVLGFDSDDPAYFKGHHFKDYVFYINKFDDETFDLVFIDGFSRLSCVTQAKNKVKSGGFIVFDNSEIASNQSAIALLNEWQRTDFFGHGPYLRTKWQTTIFKKP